MRRNTASPIAPYGLCLERPCPSNQIIPVRGRIPDEPLGLVRRPRGQLFAFAGLWEHWDKGGEPLYSCTIITTEATGLMQPIHERMPVILEPQSYQSWLDKAADSDVAFALLANSAYGGMKATPVSDWVNKPGNDGERCVEEVAMG